MCGLTGFLRKPGSDEEDLKAVVTKMTESLRHRGPDDVGIWADPEVGVALGFRRLAVIDLSPSGRQPMISANDRLVIVFNGEIFNFQDLRRELVSQGVRFRGSSDTEVILEGICAWGVDATIERLVGMFAIGIWDREECRLTLVRDRLGIKPLYWASTPSGILFSSELKALRAAKCFPVSIDRCALVEYFRYGYVPGSLSIYQAARKLEAGTLLTAERDGSIGLRRYWDAAAIATVGRECPLDISDSEAVDTLDRILRDSVARRMIADVPLGAFLSGGVDSSLVVALMQAQSSRPVHTFTMGFSKKEYDEAPHARAIAMHLGTHHTERYASPQDALEIVPKIAEIYDEPLADSSQIPTCLISSLARLDVKVCLSGDGGDELFGGYPRYLNADKVFGITANLMGAVRSVGAAALGVAARWQGALGRYDGKGGERSRRIAKLQRLVKQSDFGLFYREALSQWVSPELLVLGEGEECWREALDRSAVVKDRIGRMQLWDLLTFLPDDILTKLDRASMAVGLEARVPLLDHRLVEFVWRLPTRLINRPDATKWLLRQVLYRYVPPNLIERPKMGFSVPLSDWLRGPLREWTEDLIAEDRLRRDGILNPGLIRQAWVEHLEGRVDNAQRLWNVLMFQAWRERWA